MVAFYLVFLPPMASGAPESVAIVASGEESGSLEPCGCYEGQLGGIARRYSFIDFLKKRNAVVLPVSLGDLSRGYGRQEEIKMDVFCRALEAMGYVAHNLGEKDVEIGPQTLSYLSNTGGLVFLSSNVEIMSPFPVKIQRYVIKECLETKRPFSVAFLGILSRSLLGEGALDFVNVRDPIASIKPLIGFLRDKADLIVLLSHAPMEESVEIAKSFPEIGLILSGHGKDEPNDSILSVGATTIVSSGTKGKYVGAVKYVMRNGVAEKKSVEVVPLDRAFKDSLKMVSLLRDYQQTLQDEGLLTKTTRLPLAEGLSYTGSPVCGTCHKLIYNHWKNTRHGGAYNTLVRGSQQYDPECVQCHTTGYGYESGFWDYENGRHLLDVGCEACHGAGGGHVKNVKNPYGFVAENVCFACHDSEHSPKFQFKKYWETIPHPEEVLSKPPE